MIAELLLNAHADIKAQNDKGLTPLQSAIKQGNKEIIDVLQAASDKSYTNSFF